MKKNNPKEPKRRKKVYIPRKGTNPIELSQRIDDLNNKIEKNSQLAEMTEKALYEYITLMTNFASHDLKNAIHNLDGYVNTIELSTLQQDNIDQINVFIKTIRKTIDDFKTLAPDNSKNKFTLADLGNSIELLNRGTVSTNNIDVEYVYNKTDIRVINQSFHNSVQMINNLLINSIKALSTKNEEKKIKIEMFIDENKIVNIGIYDNGVGIDSKNKDKIFNLHFSTTGGSGIGLYHAKYIIESMNGSIEYKNIGEEYKTLFAIKFPAND